MATTVPTIMVESTEYSVPPVTLTIIPPSRPPTPQSGHQIADNRVNSLLSPSFSNLSPTFFSRPSSISDASDDGIYSCATSTTNLSINNGEYGSRSTVYHIYRTGGRDTNFTVHTVKDTKLVEQLREEIGPVDFERFKCPANPLARRFRSASAPPPKKVKADDRKTDPREAAYFLHSPLLWFHDPQQTLRFGADKKAPVVCLIEGSFFWRTWRFDFVAPEDEGKRKKKSKDQEKPKIGQRVDSGFCEAEEVGSADAINKETEKRWKGLNEPGVIDARGVLVSKYPLRPHRIGESGKEYVTEQIKRRKSLPVTPEQLASRISRTNSFSEKARALFRTRTLPVTSTIATPPPTPDIQLSESMLPAGPDPKDLPDHLKPDSLDDGNLLMKWSGWLTREYEFIYKGISFRWRGTGTVRDEKKFWGPWSKFNHLKLVAILPEDDGGLQTTEEKELKRRGSFSSFISLMSRRDSGVSITESGKEKVECRIKGGRQVVIAKYTCLAALRKAGRLSVYDYGLEQATGAHLKPGREIDFNTEKERLRHLVVATALCMLQAEKEKRDTIMAIIEGLAGAAG